MCGHKVVLKKKKKKENGLPVTRVNKVKAQVKSEKRKMQKKLQRSAHREAVLMPRAEVSHCLKSK